MRYVRAGNRLYIKVTDVRIDNSDFTWVLPDFHQMTRLINTIYGNTDWTERWEAFWKKQSNNRVLCGYKHQGAPKNYKPHLYYQSLSFVEDQDMSGSVFANESLYPYWVMPMLIPKDKDDNYELNAYDGVENGTLMTGGTLYIDGYTISLGLTQSTIMEESDLIFGISNTKDKYELNWFKWENTLIGGFFLTMEASFETFCTNAIKFPVGYQP